MQSIYVLGLKVLNWTCFDRLMSIVMLVFAHVLFFGDCNLISLSVDRFNMQTLHTRDVGL